MINVLSVDVEEYFQVEAFSAFVSPSDWASYPSRVEKNVDRVLELFAKHKVRATFFVLGWVAERFPNLAGRIRDGAHEIGSHGFSHCSITRQTSEQFRADVRRSREILSEQTRGPVVSYRAPSFSITRNTIWALDVLVDEGFLCDSSIFPIRRRGRGIHDAPRFPYWHTGRSLFEFPPSTVRIGDINVGAGGGGYLRFAPYEFTKWALSKINAERQPAMIYFHPWELDPDHPRIPSSLRSRVKHYGMISGMAKKIDRLLQDFQFTTLTEACSHLRVSCRESIPSSI